MSSWPPLWQLVIATAALSLVASQDTYEPLFVPYNSREYHAGGGGGGQRGVDFSSITNGTLAESYCLNAPAASLQRILDRFYPKKYRLLSVGDTTPFSMERVLLHDNDAAKGGDLVMLGRVTLLPDTVNPFKIRKVLMDRGHILPKSR
jgi:hypothetical protein